MPVTHFHISATETAALCGAPVLGPRVHHMPFSLWLEVFRDKPDNTCTKCLLQARRYADMRKQIDEASPRPIDDR